MYAWFVPSHVLANSSFNLLWPFPLFPPPSPICRSPRFCCFFCFFILFSPSIPYLPPDPISVQHWATLPSTNFLNTRLTRLFPAHHGSHRQCSLLLLSPHAAEGDSPMVSLDIRNYRNCFACEANHRRRIGKSGTTRRMSVTRRTRPRIRRLVSSFWIKPAVASVL